MRAHGEGLHRAEEHVQASFVVDTHQAPGDLSVKIEGEIHNSIIQNFVFTFHAQMLERINQGHTIGWWSIGRPT